MTRGQGEAISDFENGDKQLLFDVIRERDTEERVGKHQGFKVTDTKKDLCISNLLMTT